MGLITKTVIMKWHYKNKEHYISKGYLFTKIGDEFEVKVEDLTNNSNIKVNVKCDSEDCNNPYLKPIHWQTYLKCVKNDGKYYCHKCAIPQRIINATATKLKNGRSFEQWCIENDNQDVLDRWDYVLNILKPSEILYGTPKKYYFKCPRGIHKSELKCINSFTNGHQGTMNCNQCNSFAQYNIDNIGDDFLEKYWDYENNNKLGNNPWGISYASNKYVYIYCQEKDYHDSYYTNCFEFSINNTRCPYCDSKKIHPRDSFAQYHINNTDINFLDKYWDWDKNIVNPWGISRSNNTQIIYIKCQKENYHDSYKTMCNDFTNGHRCSYCNSNSGKVHPLDSLGKVLEDKGLLNLWSDKNKKSPYEYPPYSHQQVYWKCPEGKHDDYPREISSSNCKYFYCPKCIRENNESILQNKIRKYINTLNYIILHEHNCSILPINPKLKGANNTLPYDNEIKELKLIIECHGEQHYKITGFHKLHAKRNNTTPEYELHYQKVKDRYKRMFAKSQGHFYLEIPYFLDDKEETWKKLINDKIKYIEEQNNIA